MRENSFRIIKAYLSSLALISIFAIAGICQVCPPNPDALYDRQQILKQLEDIHTSPLVEESKETNSGGNIDRFPANIFVYDLTDTSNKDLFSTGCINFINNHVYHVSDIHTFFSYSHIVILEDGKLKVFKAVNCQGAQDTLEEAVNYLNRKLMNEKNRDEIITRVKNYRRYGRYLTADFERLPCGDPHPEKPNPDSLYKREEIVYKLASILYGSLSKESRRDFPEFQLASNGRGIGFFVYDLTEPSNKQTSLLERIDFKNNHIYHFAYIDLPYSFSNIAILEDGKLKIFTAINCAGKGDTLAEVTNYLKEKLKNDKNKKNILKRVKDYRKYGVYTSFNNLPTLRCEAAADKER
jgi:hypothetical protein